MTAKIETSDSISRKIEALDIVVEARKVELGANAFASLNGDEAATTKTEQLNDEIKDFAAKREALLGALVHALDREQDERDLAALASRQKKWEEARAIRNRLLDNARAFERSLENIVSLRNAIADDNEAIRLLLRDACLDVSRYVIGRDDAPRLIERDIANKDSPFIADRERVTLRVLTKAWSCLDAVSVEDHV